LVPRVLELLREAGLVHVGVLVGGIIPEPDIPRLLEMGVARVFGPGSALDEIVAYLRDSKRADHAGTPSLALPVRRPPGPPPPAPRPSAEPGRARRARRGNPLRDRPAEIAGPCRSDYGSWRRGQEYAHGEVDRVRPCDG